jgi:hypothetical protein
MNRYLAVLVSMFSINSMSFADISSDRCKNDILSVVKEGFSSFQGDSAANLTIGEKPELLDLNGKKIISYMTSLDITYGNSTVIIPNAYNFYFESETCKFLNGVALDMEKSPSELLKSLPKNCKPSDVLETVENFINDLKSKGKEVSELQYSYRVDDSTAMKKASTFAVFNLMKVNGELHVLSTYLDLKTCKEIAHYISKQNAYAEK